MHLQGNVYVKIAAPGEPASADERRKFGFALRLAAGAVLMLALPLISDGQQTGSVPGSGSDLSNTGGVSRAHITVSREGLLIANADRSTQIRIHGYVQGDGRFFFPDLHDQSRQVFLFRRIRPLVEGSIGDHIQFRFMPDFGQNNPVIREVYLEWAPASRAHLRIGKFKAPLGLESLRSDRALTFPERSLASDFMPVRDLGIQLDGSLRGESISYQLGYFSGAEDGTNSKWEWRGTNEGDARLFLRPFLATPHVALNGLGLGISGSINERRTQLPSYKTMGQETFFQYAGQSTAEGIHYRASPQGYFYRGSFGVLSELALSRGGVEAAKQHRNLNNVGWQIAGSYVLTGESNGYGGVSPSRSFQSLHPLSHPGAWEVGLRHSEGRIDPHSFPLYADPEKSAQAAAESAAGFTWYINPFWKMLAYYEYTGFRHAASAASIRPEKLAIARLQFAF